MGTLLIGEVVYPVASQPVHNGAVAIRDGKIEAVGSAADFNESGYKVINLAGMLLMPGFVNAHSHLQFSSLKGKIPQGLPFVEWIREIISLHYSQSEDVVLEAFRLAAKDMISGGTTSVADISNDVKYAQELAKTGLNGVAFVEAIEPRSEKAEEAETSTTEKLKAYKSTGLKAGVSPHAPYTVSGDLFKKLKTFSTDNSLPFTVHLAESVEEDEYIRNGSGDLAGLIADRGYAPSTKNGVSPVQLLDGFGVLENMLAVHLNILDGKDVETLITRKVVPVFCPGSSKWFGRKKVMPLDRLFNAGLKTALGTDSLASNSSLSMLDELRSALEYFPKAPTHKLISAATINGANALGLNCGSIEKGMRADIIGFEIKDRSDSLKSIFSAERPNFVMIGGNVFV